MKNTVIYIHGKDGSADECEFYKPLFPEYDVVGIDYKAETPWQAKAEFPKLYDELCENGDRVILIANSIGAYFAMLSLADKRIDRAFFISPIVDMERLILDMMKWAGVGEKELAQRGEVKTDFGEALSWEYLCYVREHQIKWKIPTEILYGENDSLTSLETITEFAEHTGAGLTVMQGGEHWFHTEEQLNFMTKWLAASIC
ncbi:alpha/beta hydrolase [Ruminococcus sp.]|uniref:alpha/beta hydrolase n=1 Tax=Ruminococcus sp. TaxID=41978 RepID=UPI0025F30398|nr:alpha/beta hydrolase [Ruminococcus sp.]MBR1432826.1 alpha/beta hydrolase [Ruminococcus sp.]